MRTTLHWLLPIIALIALGPLAAAPIAALRGADGSRDATALVNASPLAGLIALALITLLAAGAAFGSAKLLDTRTAKAVAAYVIAWPALRAGDAADILQRAGAGGLWLLVIEGLLAIAIGLAVIAAADFAGKRKNTVTTDMRELAGSPEGPLGLAAGLAAALLVSFLVAFGSLPGQALMAAMLGGAAAGAVCHLIATSRDAPAADLAAPYAVLLAAVVSPLSGLIRPGLGALESAARAGEITGPLAVQPLMWIAAALLAVPIGRGWAGATAERHGADHPSHAA